MRHKLSVLVRIDLDGKRVALVVTGSLTDGNQQALAPLVVRARTLFPESELSVELHEARPAETQAVDLLRRSLEDARPATGPVRIAVPDAPPGDRSPGRRRPPAAP